MARTNNSKMRILFLLTVDRDNPSLLGRYLPLAQGLVLLGHEVRVAALYADPDSPGQSGPGGYIVSERGVEIRYVAQMHVRKQGNVKSYYPTHKLLALTARATWALTRAALALPADVVHIGKPHPMNSVAGLLARFGRGKKVLLDCDDYEALSGRFSGAWQRTVVAFFEDSVPLHVHHVTTHARFLQDRLLNLGVPPERITRLPNGVDRERFADVDLPQVEVLRAELRLTGKRVIAFIGSLSSASHPIDLLLDAFLRVRRAEAVHPELAEDASRLLIVGGGEDYERLVERAAQIGVGDAALFVGRVTGQEVPAYYRLADVVVDPVYDDPVGQSRQPLKLFESWASGIPFVSGDVGDRAEILGAPPAGVLVRPGDPDALAEGILGLLLQPRMAAGCRRRGLERVESFYWDHLAREMEAVYRRVLAEPRGRAR